MRMNWKKKGLIFDATKLDLSWADNSALTPTPVRISNKVIRVYCGFRDSQGTSRIGYVDVDFDNPANILGISDEPCLDIGRDGCFDDNGVILGDVILHNNVFYMYYVGFQLAKKAKFLAFSGLAVSGDGRKFDRKTDCPILDRDLYANTINAIHTILPVPGSDIYRVWHAKGDGWCIINGNPYPKYNIWTSTSKDGILINRDSKLCIDVKGGEYRIGRPSVYYYNNSYIMLYTKASVSGLDYFPGIAFSNNGIDWERNDELFGLELSIQSWDSRHIAYPRLLPINHNQFYVFYNGNDMGVNGFGYALLTIEG